MIPDYLQQGMGFTPVDDSLAGAPDLYGGLHPDVANALGLVPPQPVPDLTAPAPAPVQLPSAAQPVPEHPRAPSKDFQVPVGAINGPGVPPVPTAPVKPPPQAKPQTPEQGFAAAQAQRQAAEQGQEAAIQQQAQAMAPKNAEDLAAVQRHQANIDQNNQQQKALSDAMDKEIASGRQITAADNKAIDDYKVDRGKYWKEAGVGDHIGWFVAMALSGLGDALQHKSGPNPVIQMLQDKNKEAINAQLDERDQLKEKRGRDAQAHAENMHGFESRQAELLRQQGQFDRALAIDLDLAARKSADPLQQANAAKLIADLRVQSADKQEAAVKDQASYAVQKQQLQVSQGQLGIAQQAERRAQRLQDLEYGPGGFKEQELGLKAAEEQRKALADQKKRVADEGLYNPVTKSPLLNQKGQAMMAQADQVEALARKDPAQAADAYVQYLRGQATTPQGKAQVDQIEARIKSDPVTAQQVAAGYADKLREDAKTTQVVTISDKEDRRKISDTIAAAQNVTTAISKVREFLKNDPDITDREGWGRVQAIFGQAIGDESKFLGARASSREFQAVADHIMKFDPSSWTDRVIGKTPAIGALSGLEEAIKSDVDTLIGSKADAAGWTPSTPLDSKVEPLSGRTAVEEGKASDYGVVPRIAGRILAPFTGTPTPIEAENAAPSGNTGLAPGDDAAVQSLIRRADASGTKDRAAIVQQISATIEGAMGDSANARPALAWGVLRAVQAQDQKLYNDVLARLPKAQADEIRRFDRPAEIGKIGANLPPIAGAVR